MSKLTEKRADIIKGIIWHYGIEIDGVYIISLWDLAFNINNTRRASAFVNKKVYGCVNIPDREFAINPYQIWHIFRAIRHTAKKHSDSIELKSGSNRVEFVVENSENIAS